MPDPVVARCPEFHFTFHPSAEPFNISQQEYVTRHSDSIYNYLATGALVFDTADIDTRRILLLQRSTEDSMPNRWEIPGGGCDDEDESILYAVARELWEEAGLEATKIGAPTGNPHFFASRSGKQICKFIFPVQVKKNSQGKLHPKLDPKEHQHFVWANEEQVRMRRVDDVELEFTTKELEDTVLQAFKEVKET